MRGRLHRRIRAGAAALLGACLLPAAAAAAAQAPAAGAPACRATEISRNLDFWVGNWDVYAGGALAGTDLVERILGGCAIVEHWRGSGGDEGISLFAYDARRDLWTQTWVTGDTSLPGGLKFKLLRAHTPASTTFQGEIEGRTGAVFYDRTILTAQAGGSVHQEIQVSRDGVAWRTGFDAVYVPHGAPRPH
jgi:hypothetical protein